jgi:hypothetical protein
LHDLVLCSPDQPHIRSPLEAAAPRSRLRRMGSGGRNHSCWRVFKPWDLTVRLPGSARTDQVLEDLRISNLPKSGFDPADNVRLRHSSNGGHYRRGGIDVVKDASSARAAQRCFASLTTSRRSPNSPPRDEWQVSISSGIVRQIQSRLLHFISLSSLQVMEDLKISLAFSVTGIHHGSLDNDAGSDVFPQRHYQLARQRHDGRLLETAAVAIDPFFKPLGQRRLRLMLHP